MSKGIIKKIEQRRLFRYGLKRFFKRPLNIVLIALLILGLFLTMWAQTMHPDATTVISQNTTYSVSPYITNQSAFPMFPNKTTYVKFSIPKDQVVNYTLRSLVEEKVSPTLNNPGGIKLVWTNIVNGTAKDGSIVSIPPTKQLAFAANTILSVASLTGGNFNMTLESYSYYNSSMKFNPTYAITGLALTAGSSTVLASVSGSKADEN